MIRERTHTRSVSICRSLRRVSAIETSIQRGLYSDQYNMNRCTGPRGLYLNAATLLWKNDYGLISGRLATRCIVTE
jgi:hypothetical protein